LFRAQIMAWLGHSTPAMAAHYCAQARKNKLREEAAAKLAARLEE
jgi:hypothetical protein